MKFSLKSILSSTISKVILLLLLTFLTFTVWQAGLETVYAKAIVATTNLTLSIVKKDTHIEYEKDKGSNEAYHFEAYTIIDGRKGHYSQETGGMMQPFVIIISWQIFLFFVLNIKSALRALGMNIAIFVLFQVLLLIFLSGYYTSTIQQYLFTLMIDSFYIIALVLVIKDAMLYPVFGRKKENQPKIK